MRLWWTSFLLFVCVLDLGASQYQIPDSAWARAKTVKEYLDRPPQTVKSFINKEFTNPELTRQVKVTERVNRQKTLFELWYVIKSDRGFIDTNPGSIKITRDFKSGKLISLESYLPSDGSTILLVEPKGADEVWLSLNIASGKIKKYQKMRFSIPFTSFLVMPVNRMLELTETRIPYNDYLWTRPNGEKNIATLAYEDVLLRTQKLTIPKNSVFDEEGGFVNFEGQGLSEFSIRSAAYVQYISQGFLDKAERKRLDQVELRNRELEKRGNESTRAFEDTINPFFGLDWTRNIGLAFEDPNSEGEDSEARDLRSLQSYEYIEDRGFKIDDLYQIMYLESVKNPQNFYLATIGSLTESDKPMYRFSATLVIIPHFDQKGRFELGAILNGKPVSFESLQKTYKLGFVHFVELSIGMGFQKPYEAHETDD